MNKPKTISEQDLPQISPKLKAVLLSAFVCPGAGQFLLGYKKLGGCFVLISMVCLGILTYFAIEQAQVISAKILAGEIPLVFSAIYAEVTKMPDELSGISTALTYLFFGNWATSIAHALTVKPSALLP